MKPYLNWVFALRTGRILLILISCVLLSFEVSAANSEHDCVSAASGQSVEPITLRVALYPFTPDRLILFQKVESVFECENPGVNVVLISSPNATDNYYSDDEARKKGIQYVDADVYEVDTILLAEFIALGKIAPIQLPFDDFSPESVQAVTRNGEVFGVPHWLCGNFLFYRKSDARINDARSWRDLLNLLSARNQTLLVDFKGRSTLGEWYFTALSSIVGLSAAQEQVVSGASLNADAISYMQSILMACPIGYCRSQALHDNTGFYARAFVRGQGSVYVGYSETIYYGLREARENCLPTSGCLSEDDIAVRALPPFDPTRKESGVGWVDALAVDAKLTGRKKDLALSFIRRVVSEDIYRSMLVPEWPYKSRYLLPARQGLNISDAPLYSQFFTAHSGRGTGTILDLNKKLRALAEKVNCALPVDRDDQETKKSCGPN